MTKMKEFKKIVKDLDIGEKVYRESWLTDIGPDKNPKYIIATFSNICDDAGNVYFFDIKDFQANDWLVYNTPSKIYDFNVTIRGKGKTAEEAWNDAIEGFQDDPGDYNIIKKVEE